MGAVAQALTDKDFLTATPEDQKAYLSSVDHDFAKASPAEQDAYHSHVVAPAVRANSAKMNAQPTAFEKAQSENPIDTEAKNPISRTLSSAGGTIIGALKHPLDTAKGALESLGDAATLGLTKGSPLSESVDTWLNPKTRPTWEGIKSVLPEALGQGIGTVALGEGIGAAAPPAAKLAARGARAIGDVPGAISDFAKEAPDVAAQKALRPPAKQAIRTQQNLETARPYLQGATSLEDLQTKVPAAKAEIWKPYNDAVQLVGQNVVQGPDGPTTVADLEKMRLETSAQLQSTRKLNPTDQQGILQKNGAIKELRDRYDQITGALDPQLASTGIDPELIRNVHGSVKGIERLTEGRNTLTENKPYGFGRMGKNFDIMHPIRSIGEVGGGIRDIVAGRPLISGSPTDIAVREGFRTGGSKPNLGVAQAPAVGAAPATPPAPFIVPRPVQLNLGQPAAGIGAVGGGNLAATGTAGPEVPNVAPAPPAAIPVAPPAPIAAAPAVKPMVPPAEVPRGTVAPTPIAPREAVLPGMAEHVAKQAEGAAKVKGEDLSREANTPKDINAAAGEMEAKSPLFRGTAASPQKEIFGAKPEPKPVAATQSKALREEYSPQEIEEAELMLKSEVGASQAGDKPGRYFDESEPGDVRTGSRQIRGGDWRGVKSGRNLFPFLKAYPEFTPSMIEQALKRPNSPTYERIVSRAAKLIRDEKLTPEQKQAQYEAWRAKPNRPADAMDLIEGLKKLRRPKLE